MSAPAWSGSSGADPAQGGLVRLSAAELDACFELLGFAGTPSLLQLPSPGRSGRERQHHLDSVLVALRRRGLADAGGPSETLAGLVRVLHRPERQLDLSLHAGAQGALVATGAARRGYGALAVRQGEQVALAPLRTSGLVGAMVGLIGPMSRPMGRSVNVPAEAFDAAWEATTDGSLWTMADNLVREGVDPSNASACARMCQGISALGQLGTAFYREGVAWFGPWVIGIHRTEEGYYLQLRQQNRYGGETVSIHPLDAPRLAQLAEQLLAAGPAQRADGRQARR